jgi:4-amino-4-deoxy-L-arabinose transferase-like glycosyltransferase
MESSSRAAGRVALIILAAALLFSVAVRWRLREVPLERDEGGFAYVGQLLLHGFPPYAFANDDELPGVYVAYAAIMAAFGDTTVGIHLGLLVVNLATVVLVFLFTRELFDSLAGGIAAAAYAILSVGPSVFGMAAHATHFVTFFSVAGAWVLWRALQSDKLPLLLASGLLLGTAFLMKQPGVFLPGFGVLMVLIHCARLRPFSWQKLLVGLVVFSVGAILPYAATCLWMWHAGVFDRFWFWTVTYPRQQVRPLTEGLENFCKKFRDGHRFKLADVACCIVGCRCSCQAQRGREGPLVRLCLSGLLFFVCLRGLGIPRTLLHRIAPGGGHVERGGMLVVAAFRG